MNVAYIYDKNEHMHLIEEGRIVRVEERADRPFFNTIGAEGSYEASDQLADVAAGLAWLPEDCQYVEKLHLLAITVTQNAAEIGNHSAASGNFSYLQRFGYSLLDVLGVDELLVGDCLGVADESWARRTYSERRSILGCIDPSIGDDSLPKDLTEHARNFINQTDTLSTGLMSSLCLSALQGYSWGYHGVVPSVEPIFRPDHEIAFRLAGPQFSRTLDQAEELRKKEREIDQYFTELKTAV